MIVDQELAGLEFVRVHGMKQKALAAGLEPEIFSVELGGHWTPDFRALKGTAGISLDLVKRN